MLTAAGHGIARMRQMDFEQVPYITLKARALAQSRQGPPRGRSPERSL